MTYTKYIQHEDGTVEFKKVDDIKIENDASKFKTVPELREKIFADYIQNASNAELALRYNDGKPQLVFILDFPNAISGLAKIKEFGAKKYELHNWKRGRSFRDTISSLLRHLVASQTEALDADSGLPHIDHVLWNSAALAEWYRTHPELNDWGPNLNE